MIALSPPEVLKALIEQGGPSFSPTQGCLYRGPDGRKCAAGLSITDDEYDRKMEHTPIEEVIVEFNLAFDGDMNTLVRMQSAHDTASNSVRDDPTLDWVKTLRFQWNVIGLDAGS